MKAVYLLAGTMLATTIACGAAARAEGVVTVYSADGLHDGTPNWYQTEFDAFTAKTGIKVQYVEGGSGGVVDRIAKEASNPQADIVVTLPPFIQKAAADGMLVPYNSPEAAHVPAGSKDAAGNYVAVVNNYLCFIYDGATMPEAPKSFDELLATRYKNKIQYSTPGQAGDGTAVMEQVIHAFGSKDAGFEFLHKLQDNNRGPSASTGKLTALVNKGELFVANGDMQMNLQQMQTNPNIRIFFPAGPDGKRSTFALPYYAGLVKGGPDQEAAKKLLDFLLSEDAQAKISEMAQGIPVRDDVHPDDDGFKALQAALNGVTIWNPDWSGVLHDLKDDVARWHAVTGS